MSMWTDLKNIWRFPLWNSKFPLRLNILLVRVYLRLRGRGYSPDGAIVEILRLDEQWKQRVNWKRYVNGEVENSFFRH